MWDLSGSIKMSVKQIGICKHKQKISGRAVCLGGHSWSSSDCVDGVWHRLHGALHGRARKQPAGLWSRLCCSACGQASKWVSSGSKSSTSPLQSQFIVLRTHRPRMHPTSNLVFEHLEQIWILRNSLYREQKAHNEALDTLFKTVFSKFPYSLSSWLGWKDFQMY